LNSRCFTGGLDELSIDDFSLSDSFPRGTKLVRGDVKEVKLIPLEGLVLFALELPGTLGQGLHRAPKGLRVVLDREPGLEAIEGQVGRTEEPILERAGDGDVEDLVLLPLELRLERLGVDDRREPREGHAEVQGHLPPTHGRVLDQEVNHFLMLRGDLFDEG
jgi:hypothetical protein